MHSALDGVTDGVLVVDGDWRVTTANAVVERLLGREPTAVVGADVREVFPRSVAATFHEHFGGDDPDPAAVGFEEYFPELDAWLEVRTSLAEGELTVYLRDVTDRKDLERELDQREAELDRLERINAIIQTVIRDLVGATTREEVERTVCERLAATDLYEFTWIGEREMTGDRVTRRTAAGEYDGVIDILVGNDAGADADVDGGQRPERTAMRTGETRVVRHLVDDETVPEPLRREAFARGLQSSITVPLRYGNTTYGVLSVYATRPDAFSEREQESLETLGVVTGFVINATRQRNLLLSDTVVELSFRVGDADAFFVAASARLDCELETEGIVPLDDESLLCYVRVEGAAPDDLLELADEWPAVDASRVVSEDPDDEGGTVEVTVAGASPTLVLVERAATVRSATFDRGTGVVVAEIAPNGNVREVVEAVGEAFPRSELLSKHERERPVETAQQFRSALRERLTDRQRNALQTAYHGGYFESPRDSTAEELAETLGISSPTLHYHLRAGQWKLLDAFFDGSESDPRAMGTDDRRTRGN
jgi:hypothetical protein